MLSEALAFPRADEDWIETVLIGGVLSILGFLVIPVVLVNGYTLRVTRAAVVGDETPPRFEDWTDLFVDGILVWVIQFVYLAVPAFVLGVVFLFTFTITTVSVSTVAEPGPAAGVGVLVSLLVGLFAGLVLLLAVYLLPAALANFARTEDFAAAFHLRTIVGAAFSVDYFVAMVLVVAVSIVLGFIGGLLVVVLVGIFVLFYLQVVVYHLFGQGFARGIGLETARTEPPAEA